MAKYVALPGAAQEEGGRQAQREGVMSDEVLGRDRSPHRSRTERAGFGAQAGFGAREGVAFHDDAWAVVVNQALRV